jgi:hypothetical protein
MSFLSLGSNEEQDDCEQCYKHLNTESATATSAARFHPAKVPTDDDGSESRHRQHAEFLETCSLQPRSRSSSSATATTQTKDLAPHTTGIVPVSYLPYLELYRIRIAFRHGHHVRYGGGVGGIPIPMNKAIA